MEVPAWVTEKYGNVEIHRDEDPLYQVVDFIEKTDGQQNLGVYVSDDEGRACGVCDSCRLRAKGFEEAGVDDPTRYQS